MVNRQIHALRCAASCRWKYQRGSLLGDLCASTGHPWWAMKVWHLTESLIASKDYDDWLYVHFDNNRVRLRDVISETECELLSKRRSDMWVKLGHPEYAWWDDEMERIAANTFGSYYTDLWLEKYDFDPVAFDEEYDADMSAIEAEQQTMRIFEEGLPC